MANRRMFGKQITNSSEFQMMSPSAQALYFHIGMNADDDGFCEVFTIVRMTESKPDDLRALHERGFVYLIDSKVGIVRDWHSNNDIRVDRYTRSKYLDDEKYGKIYQTIMQDKIQHLERYRYLSVTGTTVGSTDGITQDRIGKDRIGKDKQTLPLLSEAGPPVSKVKPPLKERFGNTYRVLLEWSVERRGGAKFTNVPKQMVAFKKMRIAGIDPERAKGRWIELENETFWKERGFDWITVSSSFDKRP